MRGSHVPVRALTLPGVTAGRGVRCLSREIGNGVSGLASTLETAVPKQKANWFQVLETCFISKLQRTPKMIGINLYSHLMLKSLFHPLVSFYVWCTSCSGKSWSRTVGTFDMPPISCPTFLSGLLLVNYINKGMFRVNFRVVMFCDITTQDSDGPFPWKKPSPDSAVTKPGLKRVISLAPLPTPRRVRGPTIMDQELPDSPLSRVFAESQAIGIRFELPAASDVAGKVLRHASHRIDILFQRQSPMIWKVGLCHDPKWRWANTIYGYQHAKDRWSEMIVLYISKEAYGPAMLESALIDKFSSSLV